MLEQIGGDVWSPYFYAMLGIRSGVCRSDCVMPMVPGLSVPLTHIEKSIKDFLLQSNLQRLHLLKQREIANPHLHHVYIVFERS